MLCRFSVSFSITFTISLSGHFTSSRDAAGKVLRISFMLCRPNVDDILNDLRLRKFNTCFARFSAFPEAPLGMQSFNVLTTIPLTVKFRVDVHDIPLGKYCIKAILYKIFDW